LAGEEEVVAGDVGEKRVDEMQPAQVIARRRRPLGAFSFVLGRALISFVISETSRNSF
jgi:hypothetical protein